MANTDKLRVSKSHSVWINFFGKKILLWGTADRESRTLSAAGRKSVKSVKTITTEKTTE